MEAHEVLQKVKSGEISVEEAEQFFRREPFEEMGYAKIDTHRKLRSGFAEVIFCSGKSTEHLLRIFGKIYEEEGEVLGTRASEEQAKRIQEVYPEAEYDPLSHIIRIEKKEKQHVGCIAVCTAGTADISVAEEAAQTAEYFGSNVERIYDVGVSGIHRLLANLKEVQNANCIIAVAGNGGSACQRGWRSRGQAGHSSADLGGIRREFPWTVRASHHDQFLREWDCGGQYR